MMTDCIFCKLIKREIPAEVVYEDNAVLGILDARPLAPGHTMILPKVHVSSILDLSDGQLGPVFLAVKKITDALKKALEPGGFTIGINQGRAGGQAINHLHIHIIPRWEDDGGSSIHSVVNNPPHESLEEIALKIRGH